MAAVFIGRDRERAELLAGLEDAKEGRGGVFLVAGEPGAGKTALAEKLASQASDRGARVLWSRSWEGGSAAPYWMWTQVIRELVRELDDDTIRSLPPPTPAWVTLLVPELADRLDASTPHIPPLDSEAARFYIFEATTNVLKWAAAIQPLVLVLDDVLAGDRSSLLLLRFLAPDLRSSRLLVVATYRSNDASHPSESVEVLGDLLREGSLLTLGPLDAGSATELMTAVAGVVPRKEKAAAIHEVAAGNPLFVREVTRLLAATDHLDRPGPLSIPVPGSVRAVIRRRLIPLSAETVRLLSAAAVVGRDFGGALLGAASDLEREIVLVSLSEAVALGIIAEVSESAGTYRFTHPLMREAIYEGLSLAARMQLHHRIAHAIENRGVRSPSQVEELAYHFSQAGTLAASDRVLEYARRAGDHAMETFAWEDAVVQYRRALDALARSEDADPLVRLELLLRTGEAQARAGEYQDARQNFLLAADAARRHDEPDLLARAALGMGEQLIEAGQPDRQLLDLLQDAIDRSGPEDGVLRARLLARLSLELTFPSGSSGATRRKELSLESLRIARRLGDRTALVDALRARWMALWGPDGLAERAVLAEEILSIADETGDRATELIGRAQRATCSLQSGVMTAVDADIAVHARLAAELRMPYFEWAAETIRTAGALLTGRLGEVEGLARKAARRLPGRANADFAFLNQFSTLRWEQGRLGELRDDWESVVARVPNIGVGQAWLTLATAELGDEEGARALLRKQSRDVPELPRDGLWLLVMALTSLAVSRTGDGETAAVLYPLLRPYAGQTIVLPMLHPALCLGSAAFFLGLLAAERDAWEEAELHFETALHDNERLGARLFLARTRCEYARLLIRRGDAAVREAAHRHLEQAAIVADTAWMERLADRIQEVVASVGEGGGVAEASSGVKAGRGVEPLVDTPPAASAERDVFRREGDYWTIVHDDSTVRLPDSKGLRCLARLLARPGEDVLALDLERAEGAPVKTVSATAPAVARGVADATALEARPDMGDAGDLLDMQARSEYRQRLEDLREELDEAERFNDPGRATRAREEMEFLAREVARAVGLGGRSRKAASHSERARLNVTRAIRTAIKNLARVHPSLAEHLTLTISTGRYCRYAPDPRAPIRWKG